MNSKKSRPSRSKLDKHLNKGEERLRKAILNSRFFSENEAKSLPVFDDHEIIRGGVCGRGEFGIVEEIASICLSDESLTGDNGNTQEADNRLEQPKPPGLLANRHVNTRRSVSIDNESISSSSDASYSNLDERYTQNMLNRSFMSEFCLKGNGSRYAIKRIRQDLDLESKASAVTDLAMEAHFLAVLHHPNIVRLRATSRGDLISSSYFIILDRLQCTLEQKMEAWKNLRKKLSSRQGFVSKLLQKSDWGTKLPVLRELLADRITALYDISRAMRYIHSHNIIYRDLKPCNLGFDLRGNIKLFDFGTAKELDPKNADRNDGLFNLTGLTGSRRYMAPEVILCSPYNLKADVYSFSIMCWEVITLKTAFDGYNIEKHTRAVVFSEERPKISACWPIVFSKMIIDSWSKAIHGRPSFDRIINVIRGSLNVLQADDSLNRTEDLMAASLRSMHDSLFPTSVEGIRRRNTSSLSITQHQCC